MTSLAYRPILIIGAAIVDILVHPAEPDVFESGSFAADNIDMQPGADALNEALVLAKHGKRVILNTILGHDEQGAFIAQKCLNSGIALIDYSQGKYRTGINVVLVQNNGERRFLTNKNGTLRQLSLEHIEMPFNDNVSILCFASIFVFPKIGNQELIKIFKTAKSQNIIVCADMTKCKNHESLKDMKESFSYIDYLFPNQQEAALLTGYSDPAASASALRNAGVKHVIIKCGISGCYIDSDEYTGMISPQDNVQCVDTTGAGDSFVAGFLFGLSESWDIKKCASYANHCGACAVQHLGAVTWLDASS